MRLDADHRRAQRSWCYELAQHCPHPPGRWTALQMHLSEPHTKQLPLTLNIVNFRNRR